MHPLHSLSLIEHDPLHERICNICRDPIEGLSYRCELCRFDVHPICTLLPETLQHVLHQPHPLRLLGSAEPGACAVCSGACDAFSWRYRCALCGFDIHIGCVMAQCQKTVTDRGIPSYIPSPIFQQQQYFGGYPSPNHFPGTSNMHHYNYNMPQYPQMYQQHQDYGGNGGRIGQVIFNPVKAIGTGVISNRYLGWMCFHFFHLDIIFYFYIDHSWWELGLA
ncbi:unnamed protein product [Withania somnifera]